MSDRPLNVLALGAHAADQELAAGMILAKHARALLALLGPRFEQIAAHEHFTARYGG